jgi:hypothetical protein
LRQASLANFALYTCSGYPATPTTVEEAIEKRRLDLKRLRREVAKTIGHTA